MLHVRNVLEVADDNNEEDSDGDDGYSLEAATERIFCPVTENDPKELQSFVWHIPAMAIKNEGMFRKINWDAPRSGEPMEEPVSPKSHPPPAEALPRSQLDGVGDVSHEIAQSWGVLILKPTCMSELAARRSMPTIESPELSPLSVKCKRSGSEMRPVMTAGPAENSNEHRSKRL